MEEKQGDCVVCSGVEVVENGACRNCGASENGSGAAAVAATIADTE